MRLTYLFLISILALCEPILVCGQDKKVRSKPKVAIKAEVCKSNEISFPCPKYLKIILNNDLFLARHPKYDYSVFLVSSKEAFKEDTFFENAKLFLNTLYPKGTTDYSWKQVEFVTDKPISKYEISRKSNIGFNGTQEVIVEYRQISFNNKEFVIGYLIETSKGKEAKRLFDQGLGGGSAPACQDIVKIISSITREKQSNGESACDISLQIN